MLTGLQFPFRFDPHLLKADLAKVAAHEWSPHYNDRDYGGVWRGVALRSAGGSISALAAEAHGNGEFADTPLLARCHYFRQTLAAFPCPLKSVRLLGLAPGSFIREHTDSALDYEDGEIRIHIPVQTNLGVEFYVSGERLLMEEGGCYYVNVNLPHRVSNRGAAERIHLVIDAEVNEWVHELFRQAQAEGWRVPCAPAPERGFEEFRRAAIESAELRDRLRAIEDRSVFAAAAVEFGRERGFDFAEPDITPAACRSAEAPLTGWTPVKVSFRDGIPFAEWIYTGPRRLTEPFFDDSIRAVRRNPFTLHFRRETPLAEVHRLIESGAAIPPSGFIFHMSRCGSTLLTQMFAALPHVAVISEAPAIDEVIQARLEKPDLPIEEHIRWLRWAVAALGQRRSGEETHYVVKLDSWHIHSLPLIRAAFPDTPWIFLYREPEEVVASQSARPGRLGVPGGLDPRILGLSFQEMVSVRREDWCAHVLAGFLESALAAVQEPLRLFIDYQDLPAAAWGPVARHFGLTLSADDQARMSHAAQFDAKSPNSAFQRDSEQKRAAGRSLLSPGYAGRLSALLGRIRELER